MGRKRNVMWRACLDLQKMMDEIMLKRAKVIRTRRKSHKKGVERYTEAAHGSTSKKS